MKEWIAPIAGGLLALLGAALVWGHERSWKRGKRDPDLDEAERKHLARRFRRRVQISSLLAVLGVLIGVGDQLPILRQRPAWFGLYWIGVLLLTLWVLLLAVGDYFATRAHGNAALARLRRKQDELERQVAEIKRSRSNGHRPR